ncbi:MAG: ABC transporter ATP-binding protein [Firmicutes bacterium]|nr:ABC transporter ATP-binding protein [Bacillota bacterium]
MMAGAEPTPSEILAVDDLTVRLGGKEVLSHLTFSVQSGELLAVLGPSGAGKSTLLNVIAGFIAPTSGSVALYGRTVSTPQRVEPPDARHLAMVFQSYALWPHLNVLDTVAFPFRKRGLKGPEALQAAAGLLEQLGLAEYASRRPAELSGGQQQRVGLARALASGARCILFDEPTANLDEALKAQMAWELRQRQLEAGAGGLYVTHDVQEAFMVADRVMVLIEGTLRQIGTPVALYEHPVDEVVARTTGPYSKVVGATTVDPSSGQAFFHAAGHTYPVTLVDKDGLPHQGTFLVRPEWGEMVEEQGFPATVKRLHYQGFFTDYLLRTPLGEIWCRHLGPPRAAQGARCNWRPARLARLSAPSPPQG